jgi:thiamine biosynthesis protein ThiS
MTVNGTEVPYQPMTLLAFMEHNGYNPLQVVAERNMEIITRDAFGQTRLEPGDEINILHFMGGGAERGD